MGYKDHMYAHSSKSGSEPFRFALFLGDLRWNDPKLLCCYEVKVIEENCNYGIGMKNCIILITTAKQLAKLAYRHSASIMT